ncbi:MAG: hypothetical protein O7F73_02045, partial [Gammaproteobacteria bacterium]|nr:hypothetical protein [Gammaproteobacteria bacterium]
MDKFNLKFQGEILPGRDPAQVKKLFAREFYIDNPKRVEAFFTGQEIILRRNLVKDDAARFFVALRQIGVVTHIEKIEPVVEAPADPPVTAEVETASAPEQAASAAPATRRKRQPGAPNMFDLRQSDHSMRAAKGAESSAVLTKAPMIAAAIALLAFILVGARFWSQSQVETAQGLGLVAVDPRQQPVIQSGDQLLLHDRAGLSTYRVPLADIDVQSALGFDFFSNGDLVILQALPTAGLPDWLAGLLGQELQAGNSLLRCALKKRHCSTLASGIGPADFFVDRRNNEIYLADAGADQLQKLDASGQVLASKPLELSAPLHLRFQEGILYLTQAGSDSVTILKPDERDFGLRLDQVALSVDGASQTGHIFPADLLYMNERWWAIMQSRDGRTAGLYLFTPRWDFDRIIPLPPAALPTALTQWANKVLVTDSL